MIKDETRKKREIITGLLGLENLGARISEANKRCLKRFHKL